MGYKEYLQSDEWKEKRNRRVLFDGKCSVCGSPINLQVHHLTYKNLPNEKPSDLITLCRHCHERIEQMKFRPGDDSFGALNHLIAWQFIKDHKDQDRSSGGKVDFCKLEVIKKHLYPYYKEHIGNNPGYVCGSNIIQSYFRNRRYEIILDYMQKGYPQNIVYNRTLFSRSMIAKVYENPEQARDFINKEKEERKFFNI